jgi:hypothetical protein
MMRIIPKMIAPIARNMAASILIQMYWKQSAIGTRKANHGGRNGSARK